jgi:hypothetical protein
MKKRHPQNARGSIKKTSDEKRGTSKTQEAQLKRPLMRTRQPQNVRGLTDTSNKKMGTSNEGRGLLKLSLLT